MKFTLDQETHLLVKCCLAFLDKKDDYIPGLVKDAVMTGLLSRSSLGAVLAEARAAVDLLSDCAVDIVVDEQSEQHPRSPAAQVAEAMALCLDMPVERIVLAAARVGMRKLCPPDEQLPPWARRDALGGAR